MTGTKVRSLACAGLTLILASACRDARFEAEMRKVADGVDRMEQQTASLQRLIWLDVATKNSKHADIARRIDDAKQRIAQGTRGDGFLIAAIRTPETVGGAGETISVFFYDEKNDVNSMSFLDDRHQVIAGGNLPHDLFRGVYVACHQMNIRVKRVSAQPHQGFVDGNQIETAGKGPEIAFVGIGRKGGISGNIIPVTSQASIGPD